MKSDTINIKRSFFRSSSVPNVSNKEGKLIIIPNGVTTNIQLMQQQQTNSQQPFSTTTQINTDQINFKVCLYQLYFRKYKK